MILEQPYEEPDECHMDNDALEMMPTMESYVFEVNNWYMYAYYDKDEDRQSSTTIMKMNENIKVKYDD